MASELIEEVHEQRAWMHSPIADRLATSAALGKWAPGMSVELDG